MLKKYGLLLSMVPLAGCIAETRREAVVLHAPSATSQKNEQTGRPTDAYGLQAAISMVRQQPWCARRTR